MPFEFLILVAVVFALYQLLSSSPTSKGSAGEAKVSAAIRRHLPTDEYFLINDVVLRDDRGETQIDHIVVSRFGVFVIETKNYSGWIFGSAKDRTWTQTFRRKRFKFQNPLRQNYRHVKAVEHHLNIPKSWIYSVVLFVGQAKFKTIVPANVTSLPGGIRYIRSFSAPIMSDAKAAQIEQSILTGKPRQLIQSRTQPVGVSLAYDAEASGEFSDRWTRNSGSVPLSGTRQKRRWSGPITVVAILIGATYVSILREPAQEEMPQYVPKPKSTRPSPIAKEKSEAQEPTELERESPPIRSFDLSGRVVKVLNGDTVRIKKRKGPVYKIRLYGIDAPEYKQQYGKKAKKALSSQVYQRTVSVEVAHVDNQGITYGVVYFDGKDINMEMVCGGHAWWIEQEAPSNQAMKVCQRQARVMALGLWAGNDPVPPWEYRENSGDS